MRTTFSMMLVSSSSIIREYFRQSRRSTLFTRRAGSLSLSFSLPPFAEKGRSGNQAGSTRPMADFRVNCPRSCLRREIALAEYRKTMRRSIGAEKIARVHGRTSRCDGSVSSSLRAMSTFPLPKVNANLPVEKCAEGIDIAAREARYSPGIVHFTRRVSRAQRDNNARGASEKRGAPRGRWLSTFKENKGKKNGR